MSEQVVQEELAAMAPAERLYRMRHSAAHVMAQAVVDFFPEAKLGIGPPIENGFYYDFDLPRPLTPDDLARGKRALVKDAAFASLVGALYGGVILVGFALELGAKPFIIGLLAAIPFFAQFAQLPAIALVERLRQRRKIAVFAVSVSRLMILALAAIAFIGDPPKQLAALVLAQLLITICGSIFADRKNSSTARRVLEPDSNSTNGWPTRSCGSTLRFFDSGCLAAVTTSSSSCNTGTVTRSG